jgi:hypothetical protein
VEILPSVRASHRSSSSLSMSTHPSKNVSMADTRPPPSRFARRSPTRTTLPGGY